MLSFCSKRVPTGSRIPEEIVGVMEALGLAYVIIQIRRLSITAGQGASSSQLVIAAPAWHHRPWTFPNETVDKLGKERIVRRSSNETLSPIASGQGRDREDASKLSSYLR